MALKPAAGARDLNPREVESNRWICEQLAKVYRLWGYAEVAPPVVERLETLEAGGGINKLELLRLAAAEPVGLRPEMTASIARTACTRMAVQPRPLRLWSNGVVFRCATADGGQHSLEERLQSGVELLGASGPDSSSADVELLALLLACLERLNITTDRRPSLLLGHHGLLSALLDQVPDRQRTATRRALTSFDPLALSQMHLPGYQGQALKQLMGLRGKPEQVLYQLEQQLGPSAVLNQLEAAIKVIAPIARSQGIRLQLDPSFQPHYDLYDGLVLQLVCQGANAPVAIASGGRYDALVSRFGGEAGGLGFSFEVGAIRELLGTETTAPHATPVSLVSFQHSHQLAAALAAMRSFHQRGERAELLHQPCESRNRAENLAVQRGCSHTHWLGDNP